VKLTACVGLFVAAALLLMEFGCPSGARTWWLAAALVVAVPTANVETFYIALYRSMGQFHRLGWLLQTKNVGTAALAILPALFGFYGLVARYGCQSLLGCLLLNGNLDRGSEARARGISFSSDKCPGGLFIAGRQISNRPFPGT
jgi:O-antigen/teichoic acid export membrane protein